MLGLEFKKTNKVFNPDFYRAARAGFDAVAKHEVTQPFEAPPL